MHEILFPQKIRLLILTFVLLLVLILAVLAGRYPRAGLISPWAAAGDPLAMSLILGLRLPRVIAAALLGAGLAAAGTVFQMLFANPLVEPGFLGVSQGAAFGASLSIVAFSSALWAIQITAGICALAGLALSYLIARHFKFGGWVLRLILAGIAVSALFAAGVGLIKYTADPLSELPEITFWMLGGLWGVDWRQVTSILPISVIGLIILFGYRWRLNLLSMDDRTAFSLGLAPFRERIFLLLTATVVTSAAISISGIVGWAGLIVPHISRRVLSSDGRTALPGSMVIGAIYIVVCDTAARTLLEGEIPLGVLTSLIGAGLFIVLLTRSQIRKGKHHAESYS